MELDKLQHAFTCGWDNAIAVRSQFAMIESVTALDTEGIQICPFESWPLNQAFAYGYTSAAMAVFIGQSMEKYGLKLVAVDQSHE